MKTTDVIGEINKTLANMPYGGLCQFVYLADDDSPGKCLHKLHTNLQNLQEVLKFTAKSNAEAAEELAVHRKGIEGLATFCKLVESRCFK